MHRSFRAVVLSLLLALPCAADTQALSVTLKRSTDQAPVRGVRVKVDDQTATSDYAGVATLPFLPAAPKHIAISDLDYLHVDRDLTAQEAAGAVEIALVPVEYADVTLRAMIAGVKDAIAGAHVVFERQGADFAPVRVEAWTGFDGAITACGVPCGKYRVSVEAPGCDAFGQDVDLAAGKREIEAALPPQTPTSTVTGSIIDASTGKAIAGAAIDAVHPSAEWDSKALATTTSGGDGGFTLAGVPSGIRMFGTAEAPIEPSPRRVLLRVRAQGYLDGVFASDLGAGSAPVRALLWPALGVVQEKAGNNSAETAQTVPPTCTIRFAIDSVGEKDFFLLHLPSDGLLRLKIPELPAPLCFQLFGPPRGERLADLVREPKPASVWEIGLRAGAYVLSVEKWGNDAKTTPIDLGVEFHLAADACERNNEAGTAAEVAPGEKFDGFLFPVGNLDYFRFRVATPGVGRYFATGLPIANYGRVLTDALAGVADSVAEPGRNRQIDFSVQARGTYYLETEKWGRDALSTVPYRGALDYVPGDAGEAGGRDETLQTAQPIEVNGFRSGTLNPVGDQDWYRVQVIESGMLRVRVTALPIPTFVRVMDSGGTEIADRVAETGRMNELFVPLHKRGVYHVEVEKWGRDAWSPCPYLLSTAFYPNDPRDRRENETRETATPITVATRVEGNIAYPGDRDFYRLHVPARGVLHAHLGPTSVPSLLRILDKDGKPISDRVAEAGKQNDADAQIAAAGWQTVWVEKWGNDAWAREPYLLTNDVDLEDPLQPHNDAAHATRLPARTSLSGAFLPVGLQDYYAFFADRKDKYRLTVTQDGLPRFARVFDAQGKPVVDRVAEAGQDLTLEWETPAAGPYVIEVEKWGRDQGSARHHSIHAEAASEPAPPIAHLTVAASAASRRKVTFQASAEGPSPIVSYEIDDNGDGTYDWSSKTNEAFPCEYKAGGWVTAWLRVTDANGAVGYDYARFSTKDPREEGAIEVEFLQPTAESVLDATTPVEAIAWSADGRPITSVEFLMDGQPIGRRYSEPYTMTLEPLAWAGKKGALVAVAHGAQDARAEIPIVFAPLVGLMPPDGALFTSENVAFEWDTAEASSSDVVVKGPDGKETPFAGEAGKHHRVEAKGLAQGMEYTWVARSGNDASPPRRLRLVRGIEFVDRAYAFPVQRDYDQRGSVRVVNHGEAPERLRIHVASEQQDLLVGFVGEGSPDKVIELAPGEHRDVLLGISAQDAIQEKYVFPITLEGMLAGEHHTDQARVEVDVKMPHVDYDVRVAGQDAGTLAYDVEVTNKGDKVTDFKAHVEGAEGRVYLCPAVDHARLDAGATIRFQVVPLLSESFQPLQVKVVLRAIHVEKEVPLSFALPEGKKVFQVTLDANTNAGSNAAYCTNNPNVGTTLPVPGGPQIGNPVGVRPPTGGPVKPRDLGHLRDLLLDWIKRNALNPKHEKILKAILDKHIYPVGDHYEGDATAAIREMMSSLTDASRAELTDWERFLSDTSDPNDAKKANDPEKNRADIMSTLSDMGSIVGGLAGSDDLRKWLTEASEAVKSAKLGQIMDVQRQIDNLQMLLTRGEAFMKDVMEGNRAVNDFSKLQALGDKMARTRQQIQDFQTSLRVYNDTLKDLNVAAQADKDLAQKIGNAGNLITVASFGLGWASRYQMYRRKGYDPAAAFNIAMASSALYNAATSVPEIAVVDLAQTIGEGAGVPGAKNANLANMIDMGMECWTYLISGDTFSSKSKDLQAAMNALPMERIRQTLARLNDRIAKATTPEEIARLRKLSGLLNQILAEKEKDP